MRSRGPNTCVCGAATVDTMACSKSEQPATLHRQAATLRVKYFKGRCRVAPGHIGFHRSNRGGEAPNGEQCVRLLENILRELIRPSGRGPRGPFGSRGARRERCADVQRHRPAWGPADDALDRGHCGAIRDFESQSLETGVQNILGRLNLGVAAIADFEGRASMVIERAADRVCTQRRVLEMVPAA